MMSIFEQTVDIIETSENDKLIAWFEANQMTDMFIDQTMALYGKCIKHYTSLRSDLKDAVDFIWSEGTCNNQGGEFGDLMLIKAALRSPNEHNSDLYEFIGKKFVEPLAYQVVAQDVDL